MIPWWPARRPSVSRPASRPRCELTGKFTDYDGHWVLGERGISSGMSYTQGHQLQSVLPAMHAATYTLPRNKHSSHACSNQPGFAEPGCESLPPYVIDAISYLQDDLLGLG